MDDATRLRKEGAEAIVQAGIDYLIETRAKVTADEFMIWLSWSIQDSSDGKHFRVSRNLGHELDARERERKRGRSK